MIHKWTCTLVLAAAAAAGAGTLGCGMLFASQPAEQPVDAEAQAVAAKQVDQPQTAATEQAKQRAEQTLNLAPYLRIREYLRLGDEASLEVLLHGYDYRGERQPASRQVVLVETQKKDTPGAFGCPLMGGAFSRGGEMEWCLAHYLYDWSNPGAETRIAEAKKYYNQALDMDPNNVQALVGLANLYLVQAVAAEYDRQRLRLDVENVLVGLKPRDEAKANPLDLTLSDLLTQIRPTNDPDENTRINIRQMLWRGVNLKNLITYYLRTARARCEDALRINGQYAPAHLGLAASAAVAQDWKTALATLTFIEENKLEIQRKRSMFYVWKGFVLEQLGSVDEAVKAYTTAIELDEPYQFMEFPRGRLQTILLSRQPR